MPIPVMQITRTRNSTENSEQYQCVKPNLKLHRFSETTRSRNGQIAFDMQALEAHGTALATRAFSSRVDGPSPRRSGHGGRRNRAERVSEALTERQVGALLAAASHAERIGLPLNRLATLHWQRAGVPPDSMASATGRYLDMLAKKLARHGSATAVVWAHENGPGKGGHLHLLAHIPPHLVAPITRLQRRWLRKITGKPYRPGTIRSVPVGGRLALEKTNPHLHAINLAAAIGYLVKAAAPAAATQFGLSRLEPGGTIIGKRCGFSQNLGPAARRKQ